MARTRNSKHELTPETVRAVRKGLYLTQEQFATLLHVNRRTVIRWEQGSHLPRKYHNEKRRAAFYRLWAKYREWLQS
jgi:DNA-binding transcriptional regulator YiaG